MDNVGKNTSKFPKKVKSGEFSTISTHFSTKKGKEVSMLYGEFFHNIDAKGRMNFPARMRDELGDRFCITL